MAPNQRVKMNKDIQKGAASTPFLLKLWDMLEEPGNEHIIAWDPFGEDLESSGVRRTPPPSVAFRLYRLRG